MRGTPVSTGAAARAALCFELAAGQRRGSGLEMVRQISVSDEAPKGVDGPGLGDWFSQALRAKGSPLQSRPPAPEPPVPELAPSEAEVEDPAASFAGWLARDLTPKHSVRPSPFPSEAAAPESVVPAPAFSDEASFVPGLANTVAATEQSPQRASIPALVGADAARPIAAQDSLAPLMVPPAESVGGSERELDDDDLSVLPGRRKAKAVGPARLGTKKYALGVLALLLLVGAFVTRKGSGPDASLAEGTHAAAASDVAAALPPPPTDVPAELEPVPEAPSVPRVKHSASSTEPEEPADPRSFLGGPSIRRYADVASPTLSKLAAEQRRLQRQRDEVVRKAKAKAAP
jgi:hypothetical protein